MTQLIENLALLLGGLAAGVAVGRTASSSWRPQNEKRKPR